MKLQKTFGPLLLFLLMIQWTAIPVLWQWRLAEVKHEATESMDEGPLQQITLSRQQFISARVGKKEIRLEGNMYDLKSITFVGDSVHLTAKRDYKEEKLLHTGQQITHQQNNGEQHHTHQISDIFYTVFIIPEHRMPSLFIEQPVKINFMDASGLFASRSPGCPEKPPQWG